MAPRGPAGHGVRSTASWLTPYDVGLVLPGMMRRHKRQLTPGDADRLAAARRRSPVLEMQHQAALVWKGRPPAIFLQRAGNCFDRKRSIIRRIELCVDEILEITSRP